MRSFLTLSTHTITSALDFQCCVYFLRDTRGHQDIVHVKITFNTLQMHVKLHFTEKRINLENIKIFATKHPFSVETWIHFLVSIEHSCEFKKIKYRQLLGSKLPGGLLNKNFKTLICCFEDQIGIFYSCISITSKSSAVSDWLHLQTA